MKKCVALVLACLVLASSASLLQVSQAASIQPTASDKLHVGIPVTVDAGSYWYTTLSGSGGFYGGFSCANQSDISFFICDSSNFTIWSANHSRIIRGYDCQYGVRNGRFSFFTPYSDTWYMVLDNTYSLTTAKQCNFSFYIDETPPTVTVTLENASTGNQLLKTSHDQYGGTVFGLVNVVANAIDNEFPIRSLNISIDGSLVLSGGDYYDRWYIRNDSNDGSLVLSGRDYYYAWYIRKDSNDGSLVLGGGGYNYQWCTNVDSALATRIPRPLLPFPLLSKPQQYATMEYPWETLSVSNGQHTITVYAKDCAGNIGSTTIIVNVDNSVHPLVPHPLVPITPADPRVQWLLLVSSILAFSLIVAVRIILVRNERAHYWYWDSSPRRSPEGTFVQTEGKWAITPELPCMICNLEVRTSDEVASCPYCGNIGHKNHLLEWLHTHNSCPMCQTRLNEKTLREQA